MPKTALSTPENDDIRRRFFQVVFGDSEGYLALAVAPRDKSAWKQAYFHWPSQADATIQWISDQLSEEVHLYYSPMLYGEKRRISEAVTVCPVLWSDLDEADPKFLEPAPNIVVQTSPGRWQALWRLSEPAVPTEASRASRRLAYHFGADPSGWDLTQLLRIPITFNPKYANAVVEVVHVDEDTTFDIDEFLRFPEIPNEEAYEAPFPDKIPTYEEVINKYRTRLPIGVVHLHDNRPREDFSKQLWHLEQLCFEAGLTAAETFVVAETSEANKYARDGRSRLDLWREVCKAQIHALGPMSLDPIELPEVLSKSERSKIRKYESFVDRYVAWAKERTDAPEKYHEAGGFVLLSAILAENIRLDLANAAMIPNLWFMILGDTTTTRKTTTIEMAVELLFFVYEESFLATEATVEGLLTALSTRSGRSSVFVKDEFSGMLDAMKRKDYFAGMSAMLARLYDGRHEKRVLKQAVYEVRDPVLIMYCGGAKSRIYSLLNEQYIIDGFVPRFIFVTAEPDIKRLRPMQLSDGEQRQTSNELVAELAKLHAKYDVTEQVILGEQTLEHKKAFMVTMTQEALDRYNKLEYDFLQAAQNSDDPDIYLPTMDRLAKSGLRVATLLAAARQDPPNVTVELVDVLKALSYIEGWLPHTLEVVHNIGKSVDEKTIDRVMRAVNRGVATRSSLARSLHFSSRELDYILDEMEARGLIVRYKKTARNETIYPSTLTQARR